MTSWSTESLARIAICDDPHVAPYQGDGTTPGNPDLDLVGVVDGQQAVAATVRLDPAN